MSDSTQFFKIFVFFLYLFLDKDDAWKYIKYFIYLFIAQTIMVLKSRADYLSDTTRRCSMEYEN